MLLCTKGGRYRKSKSFILYVSSHFVIKEEVFIHKKYLLTRLPDGHQGPFVLRFVCISLLFC